MELFQYIILQAYHLFDMDFTIYGVTFSFLDVAIWGSVASALIYFVGRLLNGD